MISDQSIIYDSRRGDLYFFFSEMSRVRKSIAAIQEHLQLSSSFNRSLFYNCLAACVCSYNLGCSYGITSLITKEIEEPWLQTTFAAVIHVGTIFGTIFSFLSNEEPDELLFLSFFPYVIGWFFQLISHQVKDETLAIEIMGRILLGIGGGITAVSCPIYLYQLSSSKQLTGFFQVSLVTGIFSQHMLLSLTNNVDVVVVINFLLTILVPIAFHLASTKLVRTISEYDNDGSFSPEPEENFRDGHFSGDNYQDFDLKQTMFTIGIVMSQQFCGLNVVNFFLQDICNEARVSSCAVYVTSIQVIVTTIASFGIYKSCLRVKSNLVLSKIGVAFSLLLLSVADFTDSHVTKVFSAGLFQTFFAFGLGPVVWIIAAENFRCDKFWMGIAVMANHTASLMTVYSFGRMRDIFGEGSTFMIYAVFTAISAVTVFIFMK